MEKISQQLWTSHDYEIAHLPIICKVEFKELLHCDIICYNVKCESVHHRCQSFKTVFNTGEYSSWMVKGIPFVESCKEYFTLALCLINCPKYYPVDTYISYMKGTSLQSYHISFNQGDIWGIGRCNRSDSPSLDVKIFMKARLTNKKIDMVPSEEISDLSNLLFKKDGDITLCGSDWEFICHKNVLIDRSAVFEAMFNNNMTESLRNRVEITDLDGPTVQSLLMYFYTLKPLRLNKLYDKLLYASHKYQVDSLKARCIDYMLHNITIENSLHILSLSDLYDSDMLNSVLKFINLNLEKIISTEDWNKLEQTNKNLCHLFKLTNLLNN